MYQPNIPIVYRELENRSYNQMRRVTVESSIIVTTLYILASIFGYLCFTTDDELILRLSQRMNILEIGYEGSLVFKISVCCLLFTVISATAVCVLPMKDTYEELVFGKTPMSNTINIVVTFVFVSISYLLAVVTPNIGDAVAIVGFTTNPMMGFILPIVFYLKIVPDCPVWEKVTCFFVLFLVISLSVVGLSQFILIKFGLC